ncbi:MAG: RelA/SpoT family protein [Treponema sp.]
MIRKIDNITSIDKFLSLFPIYTEDLAAARSALTAAWESVLQKRIGNLQNGNIPHDALHSLRMAYTLAGLGMDSGTIVCALLYSENNTPAFSEEEITAAFGASVVPILQAAATFSDIKLYNKRKDPAGTICKMFLSMVNDLRIMIFLLADRLDKIQYVSEYPENRRKPMVHEIIEIWAPLAQRMGISTIQHELEDLSLKYLNREAFNQIKAVVAAKKKEREAFLQSVEHSLYAIMQENGISVKVQSRAKHFWSIYQKMVKRNKTADELYDLLAVRILCASVSECYTILGLVHTLWKPLEGRFKDYIAMSKPNGYQSLHTTVLCDEGQTLEIQIRTHDMHEVAERGVASHWVYKKRDSHSTVNETELSFVRQVKILSEKKYNDDEFLAQLKNDLLGDSIYVFTPQGDIIELPAGSTAIDFAYSIHSEIGEKIISARADGVIIPLSRPLKNTQVIEIITHPHAHPTLNQYANAHTSKARQKIRAWLQQHTETAQTGDKSGKSDDTLSAEREAKQPHHRGKGEPQTEEPAILQIRIDDSTNFLVKFAKCCNPTAKDSVCGYVSRGRGVIIHKKDCPNLKKIPEIDDRIIQVELITGEKKQKQQSD